MFEFKTILLSNWFLICLIAVILYWYLTLTFDHWRKKGVHFLKPTPFVGNIGKRVTFRTSYHEFQRDLYKRCDGYNIAGFFEGRNPVLMVRDPELIRQILVQNFDHFLDRSTLNLNETNYLRYMLVNLKGKHWKSVRAQMTSTFSSRKMKIMTDLIVQCGKQLCDFLQNRNDGPETEMKTLFGRFTMDVIATCAFGVQCDSFKDPEAEFVAKASHFGDVSLKDFMRIFAVMLIAPKLSKYIELSFLHRPTCDFLAKVVYETMKYRKENPEKRRNDFLQIMLEAAEKEQSQMGDTSVITKQVIVAQSIMFLIAAYETSSTVLTMAAYELALNQDVQDKLRQEVKQVMGKHDGNCTIESLQEMTYMDMVISETLRKYPPLSRLDRTATKPYIIKEHEGAEGVVINKGDVVIVPVFGLHYDEKYWPTPDKFDPERFTSEEKARRSPYVYLPFGAGPRNCIGIRFAMLSTKMAMAYLINDFVLEPNKKTEVPFQFNKFSMLLKSKNGVWLNMSPVIKTNNNVL